MKTKLQDNPSTPLRAGTSTPLRSGYTTGACAAAAAKGAALMLKHQMTVREVTIELPAGCSATFRLSGQNYSVNAASCFVIKDAGDDPDITNGAEVHATVSRIPSQPPFDSAVKSINVVGGKGIGRVTKPGLAVAPGEWAINPVPRRMIEEAAVSALSSLISQPSTFNIVISIPDGEERSKKTLNARLGIIGGLSILGTTGIVRPISAKAWTDTIDAALDVAKACGCETVVLSTGRTSELAAQNFLKRKNGVVQHTASLFDPPQPLAPCSSSGPSVCSLNLPEEAYIMMGDHIAYAEIRISAACNRVATWDGHLEAASVEFGTKTNIDQVRRVMIQFVSEPQTLKLPTAPEHPIIVRDEVDRPQPRLDRDLEKGMASVVGRLRECSVLDYKFIVLGHNTLRGAAGGTLLNAELLAARKFI